VRRGVGYGYDDLHVSKVIGDLQQASHLRLIEEIIDRVQEDICRGGASREEREPLPVIVLRVEDEVDRDDGGAHGHHGEDEVHKEHEAIDVVEFV
jgi:hypothetical protein